MTTAGGFPLIGFFIAVSAASALLVAALALAGLWIPTEWWRPLTIGGAALSIAVMALFLGPSKVIPIVTALALIAIATDRWHIPGV